MDEWLGMTHEGLTKSGHGNKFTKSFSHYRYRMPEQMEIIHRQPRAKNATPLERKPKDFSESTHIRVDLMKN